MKFLMKLVFLLIPFFVLGQTKQDSINSRIQLLIEKQNNNTISSVERKTLYDYGYQIQNKGMYLESYKFDYNGALPHIERAIEFWVSIRDSMNEANLRKYRGYILGFLNRFEEGKKDINYAYHLYGKSTKDIQYQMVCLYDLSLLYEKENSLDSALYYGKITSDFYSTQNNEFRLFVVNNHLINVYRKRKEYKEAEKLQIKNEQISLDGFGWQQLINFYYVSEILYAEINKPEMAYKYKLLYGELRDKEFNESAGKLKIKSIFE